MNMRMQEVCHNLRLTKKAVEYYVAQGLVQPHVSANGYRDFTDEDVQRLRRIAVLRRLGLNLSEIREVLAEAGQDALKQIAIQHKWAHDREQTRLALLQHLQESQDWEAAEGVIASLEHQYTLEDKLLDAFPGDFGQYAAAHFASFLPETLETPEQQKDFATILQILDDFPTPQSSDVPLQDSGWTRAQWQQLSAAMQEAAANPARFLEDHTAQIEAYHAYKQSPAYAQSPAAQQAQYWTEWVSSSAYREQLIPALSRISPAYRRYVTQLAQAARITNERT